MEGFRTPDGRVLLPRRIRAGAALVAAAADEGHVPAFQRLALCYDCGEGVQRSEEAALYWYRRAFRGGDVSAAFNASTVYRDRGDRRGQRRWLRRGADLGDPDAVLELAKLTLDSKVTVAARTEALRGLAKLARQAGTPLGAEAHRLLHRYDSSKRRSGSKRP